MVGRVVVHERVVVLCVCVVITFDDLLQILQVELVLTHQTLLKLPQELRLPLHLQTNIQGKPLASRQEGHLRNENLPGQSVGAGPVP